jgi:hypothetical protein
VFRKNGLPPSSGSRVSAANKQARRKHDTVFYDVASCDLVKSTGISEERTASIFGAEE